MKIVNPDSPQYAKVFSRLVESQCEIIVWQMNPNNQKRTVNESTVKKVSNVLKFSLPVGVTFDAELPMYFYIEDGQIIFKTQFLEYADNHFCVALPPELKFLDEPESETLKRGMGVDVATKWKSRRFASGSENISTFIKPKKMAERSSRDKEFLGQEFDFMSLDEEDKLFADKRESKRVKPKTDKLVKILVNGQKEAKVYKLFDLSQGGMAFVAYDLNDLPKAAEIQVLGFDAFDLDDPLYGTIMSHRAVDEAQVEFKVGIKFSDGQN